MEEWRTIPSAPEYQASSLGRVRRPIPTRQNPTARPLTPSVNLHGYLFVSISVGGKKKSKNVHSLICETFHGPRPTAAHEVAHNDGDQRNNCPENLRWATRRENFADRDKHGRTVRGERHHSRLRPETIRRGGRHPNALVTEDDVLAIRASNARQADLAAQFGLTQSTISDIKTRKSWRHI